MNTSALFKRAVNKINNFTAAERAHSVLAPQVYDLCGETNHHLADGILLYQV